LRIVKINILTALGFALILYCNKIDNRSQENTFTDCNSLSFNSAHFIRLNLDCPDSYTDGNAPVTLLLPAGGRFSQPVDVSAQTNDRQASTYYSIDKVPSINAANIYSQEFIIDDDGILNYFSVDTAGNAEQNKLSVFEFDPDIPNINIISAENLVMNADGELRFQFSADTATSYAIVLEGSNSSNGKMLAEKKKIWGDN